jgi:hypothetical protein
MEIILRGGRGSIAHSLTKSVLITMGNRATEVSGKNGDFEIELNRLVIIYRGRGGLMMIMMIIILDDGDAAAEIMLIMASPG